MYKELQITIEKANKEYKNLLVMVRTDHSLIPIQIITIDRLMTILIVDHNYNPTWQADYDRICDSYFEPIRVRNTEYISASEISFPFSYN